MVRKTWNLTDFTHIEFELNMVRGGIATGTTNPGGPSHSAIRLDLYDGTLLGSDGVYPSSAEMSADVTWRSSTVVNAPTYGEWHTVRIPLSAYTGLNRAAVTGWRLFGTPNDLRSGDGATVVTHYIRNLRAIQD
jgi:hypothetical protein